MKFRHLEKVRVRSGYYRNYCGIVVGFQKVLEIQNKGTVNEFPVEAIVYSVKLTISKDPFKEENKEFRESELAARLF